MSNKTVEYKSGSILFKENDRSQDMYIIQEGKVKVYKYERGQRINICEISKGGIIGEMSLLDGRPRSATVEAVTDTKMSVITPSEFEIKAKQIPEWFFGMIKILCARLRAADRRLKNSIEEEEIANTSSLIAIISKSQKNKDKILDQKFIKSEIIDILGLSKEKIPKYLNNLRDKGLIDLKSNNIYIKDEYDLVLYADYMRSIAGDVGIKMNSVCTDKEKRALKKLYFLTRNKKANKSGEYLLDTEGLEEQKDVITNPQTDFINELYNMHVIKKGNNSDNQHITINQGKLALIFLPLMFA